MAGFINANSLSGFFSGVRPHVSPDAAVFGVSSSINRCCSTMARTAIARATPKAIRTPVRSPHASMKSPPRSGPRAMGMRRTSECMLTPMVRLCCGRTL